MAVDANCADAGWIRRVAWSELFPWLMIFRALRLSTSAPILLVATVAMLLLPWGWRAAALVLDESQRAETTWSMDPALGGAVLAVGDGPRIVAPSLRVPSSVAEFVDPMVRVFTSLVDPVRHWMRQDIGGRELAYWGLGFAWTVALWGWFGGIMVRVAVMRCGREEREGLVDAARFVLRRYASYVGTPFFALAGVAAVALLATPVGLLLRWDVGVLVASVVWLGVLLGGLLAAVVLLGLVVGWPLMWGAISSEEMGDVFEATQRAFSYTFGRPIQFAFYVGVAVLAGSAAFLLIHPFAQWVVYVSAWSVSWGAGADAWAQVGPGSSWSAVVGGTIIGALNELVMTVASAFRYSFFWCAAGAIYLLLRRDSDHTEFDNVHVVDEVARFSLPPLTTDAAGVPGVDDAE